MSASLPPQATVKIHDGIVSPWENHGSWYMMVKAIQLMMLYPHPSSLNHGWPILLCYQRWLNHYLTSINESFVTTFNHYKTHSMDFYGLLLFENYQKRPKSLSRYHAKPFLHGSFMIHPTITYYQSFFNIRNCHWLSLSTRYSPLFHPWLTHIIPYPSSYCTSKS